MDRWSDGWGGALPFHAHGLLFWTLLILAVVWLVRSFTRSGGRSHAERRAGLDVLEQRYARGEIDRDEYFQKKRDIGG